MTRRLYSVTMVHPDYEQKLQSLLVALNDDEAVDRAERAAPGWMVLTYTEMPDIGEGVITTLLQDIEIIEEEDYDYRPDPEKSVH